MASFFSTTKEQIVEFYSELPLWGKSMVVVGAALVTYIPYRYYVTRPRKTPIKQDFAEDVVYLYQFPRVKCIPSFSPYCLKLETWLRMANIKYENVDCGWFTRSCEGTLPFLEYNGREYPDSSLAIRDMSAICLKEPLESHLTEQQVAAARAFEKLAECSLFPTVAYMRFAEHAGEFVEQIPDKYFGTITVFIRWFMKKTLTAQVLKAMKVVGIGKHSRDEVVNIAADDLRAISVYMGQKPYLTGFKPGKADAALFGVLAQIVYSPFELPQKTLITNELTNLKEYCDRIKSTFFVVEQFWPDWDECTTNFVLNSDQKKKL
uniref:Thioredoxin-like_fold domain-containing protein n=1 Tax=Syphacia muris TaxID=451379 RepID=A0A0N5ARX1_9BILA